ncbi:hypothetical protein [Enterobacter bugandensis]|uniref:hypothetical protein n=1 Tax=Enterobacter bugandensis TaxID=881260 RepID=UPI002362CF57|nr:hypothetical protein [Enterobacter bugandensis]
MKKVFSVDPKEIQIGIILNQIHISSNFHSDKIIDALVNIFKANQNKKEALYGEKTSYKTQRTLRHENALKRFLERDNFLAILSAGIREIETETAEFKGTNLTQEELINQFTSGMNSIYFAFEKCIKNNDFSGIHISPSYHHGPLGVRHAERNIVNYLVEYKDEIYSKAIKMHRLADGKHIILPLDGRFIPCGFCYEQECSDMDEGGVFDPKMNRFLLYRSGKRVGKFYEGEVQYMFSSGFHSDPSIAKMKAMAMLENIKNSSDKLYCYGTDIVTESSFNTDSEQSDNEIDDAIK